MTWKKQNSSSLKFFKIHKKTSVPASLFHKINSVYTSTLLKEKTPTDEFCKIHKTPFLQNTFRQEPTGFEEPTGKRKKMEIACRKTTTHAEHQVFISFCYSKVSLLLFSLLPMIHWKHQRYYIGFPGYLTVLLASDFYYIFLCCGIGLRIVVNFPRNFVI